jgi:acyl-CoA thioester hydrolase
MIAHIAIDYVAEGHYPADVLATVGVASVGTRSYRLAMALFQDARAMALAECVMVHRNGMPDELREALATRLVEGRSAAAPDRDLAGSA